MGHTRIEERGQKEGGLRPPPPELMLGRVQGRYSRAVVEKAVTALGRKTALWSKGRNFTYGSFARVLLTTSITPGRLIQT